MLELFQDASDQKCTVPCSPSRSISIRFASLTIGTTKSNQSNVSNNQNRVAGISVVALKPSPRSRSESCLAAWTRPGFGSTKRSVWLTSGWLTDHMADLNTENREVVYALESWIRGLVESIGIDAIRVDTVKHVRKDFWPGFVNAAGVAAMGEVLNGGESLNVCTSGSRNRSGLPPYVSAKGHGQSSRLRHILSSPVGRLVFEPLLTYTDEPFPPLRSP